MSSQVSSPNPCSEPLLFNDLDSRKVVADFSGGHLSSDGGLLLLRELDSSLGLTRSLAACFRDAREPLFVEHSLCELLAQRVLGLAAGYEDLNDHNTLRSDPLFALAANKSDPLGLDRRCEHDRGNALASASTLNRLELGNNKKTRAHKIQAGHAQIETLLIRKGVGTLDRKAREVVIDLDATDSRAKRDRQPKAARKGVAKRSQSASWQPGRAILSWLLRQLLLPAPLCFHRRSARLGRVAH